MTQQGSKHLRSRFMMPTKKKDPLWWLEGVSDSDLQEEYQKILTKTSKFCATKRAIIVAYINHRK